MADLNKVFLMGRLTQDPELRYTNNGIAVADLRLATSRTWSGKDGERREESLFIDVTVWNRQAETCCQYLKKGRALHVEGYLKSESWETQTGEKRTKIKVEAERVQFLDRRDEGGGSYGPASTDDEYAAPPAPAREAAPRRSPASSGPPPRSGGGGYPPPRSTAPSRPSPPPAPSDSSSDDDDIPF